ncbi:MAG: hypothetical protein AUI14_09300 [Actinobacteria bacterium 13_2_20CM_2_71_6]|nr:MAG: hypothetical protein AUI14_09300 [Actinobacteria bacterium 13_2_20CM_2_71_6]
MQRRAPGDRALDGRQLFEQPLPLLQRGEQPGVLGRLAPFGIEGVQRLDGQFEDPGHPADQAHLVDGEAVLAGAGQYQVPRFAAADGRHRGPARTRARYRQVAGPPGHHVGQLGDRYPAGGEAYSGDHAVFAHDGGHLGLDRPGRALDSRMRGGQRVPVRGHGREELGELLGDEGAAHVSSPRGRRASGGGSR